MPPLLEDATELDALDALAPPAPLAPPVPLTDEETAAPPAPPVPLTDEETAAPPAPPVPLADEETAAPPAPPAPPVPLADEEVVPPPAPPAPPVPLAVEVEVAEAVSLAVVSLLLQPVVAMSAEAAPRMIEERSEFMKPPNSRVTRHVEGGRNSSGFWGCPRSARRVAAAWGAASKRLRTHGARVARRRPMLLVAQDNFHAGLVESGSIAMDDAKAKDDVRPLGEL